MKRIVTSFIIAAIVALSLQAYSNHANAQSAPSDYSYQYNAVNIYSNTTLQYIFASLSADYTYTFTIEFVDDVTGVPSSTYKTFVVTGVTEYTLLQSSWPANTFTPFRIVDELGNVLGRHYLAPAIDGDSSWFDDLPHATSNAKTAIGNVVYNSGVGMLHDATNALDEIWTEQGNYTLLHYRTNAASVSTDFLTLRDNHNTSELLFFAMDEIVDYNKPDSWPSLASIHYESYIVLNTLPSMPSWVDQIEAATFTFDNPMQSDGVQIVQGGVYEYWRNIDGNVAGAGESLWVVTRPWDYAIRLNPLINPVDGGTVDEQHLQIQLAEDSIYNGFGGYTASITDTMSVEVLVCIDVLPFAEISPVQHSLVSIDCQYATDAVGETTANPTWTIAPFNIFASGLAQESDYQIFVIGEYELTVNVPPSILPVGRSHFTGLIDVPLIIIGLMILYTLFKFVKSQNLPSAAFKMIFVIACVGVLFSGFFDLWVNIIIAIVALLVGHSALNERESAEV